MLSTFYSYVYNQTKTFNNKITTKQIKTVRSDDRDNTKQLQSVNSIVVPSTSVFINLKVDELMRCSRQSLFGSHLILLNLFRPTLQEKCLYAELFCIPCSVFSRIRTGSLRFQSECGKKWTRIALNTETFHRVLRRPYYSDSTKNEIFALECFQFCLSLGFYLRLNTERSIHV